MNDFIDVLRHLAHRDGADIDPGQIGVTAAQHPDAVCAFIEAGCALVAADAQEALLAEAARTLFTVHDSTADLDNLVTAGQRMRAIEDALTRAHAQRDTARSRYREAYAVLQHDGALVETTSQPEPPHGAAR
ncbi:hypothetical protein ACGFI9_31570 [Micromonospora sp. NPDC048930]|uniref:hypothetical protein n=1 Tax=Micromonospora sp. NPDC048930 TaxID=3364261 RepID=UPI003723BB36